MEIFSATPAPRTVPGILAGATSQDLPAAASALAAAGIPVFPCVPNQKRPLTPRGFLAASRDATQVRKWWERTPTANLGIPTGTVSGLVVVDVDVHATGTGFPAFERARASGIAKGWAWLVRTPSGGLHAYFHSFASADQRSWQVPNAHVDFRGDGGYIVAPPSRLESASYRIIAVAQHAPRELDGSQVRRFLDPPVPRLDRPPSSARSTDPSNLAVWVAARPEGTRNHGLFWAACRMAEDGHPFAHALSTLGAAAQSAGLAEQETATTIRSAYRSASSNSAPPSLAAPAPQQGVVL